MDEDFPEPFVVLIRTPLGWQADGTTGTKQQADARAKGMASNEFMGKEWKGLRAKVIDLRILKVVSSY